MPWSALEGKDWLHDRVLSHVPASILDIGAGSGTYSDLLRPYLPNTRFTGIEVHRPYVARFGLEDKYDQLYVTDVRFMNNLPLAEVVILGDVLEHLRFDEAVWLWEQARAVASKAVLLSLPLGEYPQGACEGNAHETHLETWSDELVRAALPGIVASRVGTVVGCYEAGPS